MGANITTLVDTLFAAVLLGSAAGITVVLTLMLCVSLVSLVILLAFRPYERLLVGLTGWIAARRRNLLLFLVLLLVALSLLMLR
jgi:hypothetical protein